MWDIHDEINWGGGLAGLVKQYLAKPKSPRSNRLCQIPVVFAEGTEGAVIVFTLCHDLGAKLDEMPEEVSHPDFRTWALVDAWPYVLVSISGLAGSRDPVELRSVGRDYRM